MNKNFLVNVIASRRVIIEAENAEQAQQIAASEATASDWEIDDWKVERELANQQDVERAKRHGAVLVEDF